MFFLLFHKGKSKVVPVLNWAPRHEDVLRIRGIASHILSPWRQMVVSGQRHAPAALSHEKSTWYPLDRMLDGPQSPCGRGGEEKNSQPLPCTSVYNRLNFIMTGVLT